MNCSNNSLDSLYLKWKCTIKVFYDSKVNKMRSPDLEFHPKNRIFDLDSLRPLNGKIFEEKS